MEDTQDDEIFDLKLISEIANEALAEIIFSEKIKQKTASGDVPAAKPKSGTPEYRKWYRANKLTPEKKEEYKTRAREKEKALHALIRTVWLP
jgi:hypothetical protein